MKVLAVHPSSLRHTKAFQRLEPLGLELVAQSIRQAGHQVQLIDLQAENPRKVHQTLKDWSPDVLALSCNYLANLPEVVDLAKAAKGIQPESTVVVGGHSASFTAEEMLEHGGGAIDCVLRGEGESSIVELVGAIENDRSSIGSVPGAVTDVGYGPPPPHLLSSLDDLRPARDLLHKPRAYFVSHLDPVASIEFTRGCPWDCSFCSAWTFYGRSYRQANPEAIVEQLERIHEPNIFIVDDVAFAQASHAYQIGEAIARRGIKKSYYLETRADVLIRNKEVFKFWKELGLDFMLLGLEAIDAEGLETFRKRTTVDKNLEALEVANSLGIMSAINLIADPSWDRERFEIIRQFCEEVPIFVNISVLTPYPGTETWHTESRQLTTRDYRLFDLFHAVLPTRLPLEEYYQELSRTQQVIYDKYLGWKGLFIIAGITARNLLRGQINFLKTFLNFNQTYNPRLHMAEHHQAVQYEIRPPPPPVEQFSPDSLYIHAPQGHPQRELDEASERSVDATRQ